MQGQREVRVTTVALRAALKRSQLWTQRLSPLGSLFSTWATSMHAQASGRRDGGLDVPLSKCHSESGFREPQATYSTAVGRVVLPPSPHQLYTLNKALHPCSGWGGPSNLQLPQFAAL